MDKNYGGVVWTNHALQRMKQRGIKQGNAWATWRRPDQSRRSKTKGTWVYYKTLGGQKIEVVAKQNEKKEWLILSVWSRDVSREPRSTGSSRVLEKRKPKKQQKKQETIGGYLFRKLIGKKN